MIIVRLLFTLAVLYAIARGHQWALLGFCALVTLALEALVLIILGLTARIEKLEERLKWL